MTPTEQTERDLARMVLRHVTGNPDDKWWAEAMDTPSGRETLKLMRWDGR